VIDPAKSFDRTAEEYERTRPDYPDAVLDLVPVPSDARVLDLGAGTGKLTRVLVRRYAAVVAVEPLDRMRAVLERVVPDAEALAGTAEEIPLPDASVDAVFAAQAFHWFANDDAVGEIARVLRPGGTLCLVWNAGDESRPSPLPAEYAAYLAALHAPALARAHAGVPWRELVVRGPFDEPQEASVPHEHVIDRTGLLENARTFSWIGSRPDDEQAEILARLGALLPEGTYAVPNLANVLWATRRRDAR
jgi:ubiquinone/menaquinone biosynthesis C-methylase UbiE